jgi:hypothetical protein
LLTPKYERPSRSGSAEVVPVHHGMHRDAARRRGFCLLCNAVWNAALQRHDRLPGILTEEQSARARVN